MLTKIITSPLNSELKSLIESFISDNNASIQKVFLTYSTSPPKLLVCTLLYEVVEGEFVAQEVEVFSSSNQSEVSASLNALAFTFNVNTLNTSFDGAIYATVVIESDPIIPPEGVILADGSVPFDEGATEVFSTAAEQNTIAGDSIVIKSLDNNNVNTINNQAVEIKDLATNSRLTLLGSGEILQKVGGVENGHIIKGITVAAAVLDATQYLNIVINGTPYKLAIIS